MSQATTTADAVTFAQLVSALKKSKKESSKYIQKFGDYQRRIIKNDCCSFDIDEYTGYWTGLNRTMSAKMEQYQQCLQLASRHGFELESKLKKQTIFLKEECMHHLWQISMVIRYLFRTEFSPKKSDQCGYFLDTAMNRIVHDYCYYIESLKIHPKMRFGRHVPFALAVSDDGRYLFVAGNNKLILVWDLVCASPVKYMSGHSESILCLDYRFGTLVSGGDDCNIMIWDAYNLKKIRTLVGHADSVLSVNFNHTRDQIVSGSKDMTVLLWSVETGDLLMYFIGHEGSVYSAHFLGEQLISGSSDSTVKVWNSRDATDYRTITDDISASFSDVRVNCDSSFVACIAEEHSVMILSLPGLKKVRTIREESIQCCFHPFIPYVLALGMSNTYSVKLYDVKRDQWLRSFERHTLRVNSLIFSPDGTRLFSASSDGSVTDWNLCASFAGDISLIKYEDFDSMDYPKHDQTLHGNEDWIMSAVISTDGQRLFTGSFDGCITEYDLVRPKLIKQWTDHSETVRCMDHCNRLLVSGDGDGMIKVWSTKHGKLIHSIQAHKSAVNSVLFNEDGTEVYSCSDDMNICRLKLDRSGLTILTYKGHRGRVDSLVYLSQSTILISDSVDDTTQVWDLRGGNSAVKCFRTPHGLINDMCMNGNESLLACITSDSIYVYSWPDFKRRKKRLSDSNATAAQFHPFHYHILAVGYADGSIKIFDTNSESFVHEFADESKKLHCRVEQVCFTPNGQRLLSVGRGNGVRMWDLSGIRTKLVGNVMND